MGDISELAILVVDEDKPIVKILEEFFNSRYASFNDS